MNTVTSAPEVNFQEMFQNPDFTKTLDNYLENCVISMIERNERMQKALIQTLTAKKELRPIIKEINMKLIEEDPEYRKSIKNFIDCSIITSELEIPKRLNAVETIVGFVYDVDDEGREPTLPEQINLLSEKIDNLACNTIDNCCNTQNMEQTPTTKTEHRACALLEELKKVRERAGTKFLNSDEMNRFLRYGIDEPYRVKDGQNIRQIKKEALSKLKKMFPSSIFLSQKSTGWKNYRLVLKS